MNTKRIHGDMTRSSHQYDSAAEHVSPAFEMQEQQSHAFLDHAPHGTGVAQRGEDLVNQRQGQALLPKPKIIFPQGTHPG